MNVALVLPVRRPRLGDASPRLIAAYGEHAACALQERLVECALEDLAGWPGRRVIVLDPADGGWTPDLAGVDSQRLEHAHAHSDSMLTALYARLHDDGTSRVAFLWDGVPTLTAADFDHVAGPLAPTELAVVPAADGSLAMLGTAVAPSSLGRLAVTRATATARLTHAWRQCGGTVRLAAERTPLRQPQDVGACGAALASDPRPARRRLLDTISALDSVAGRRALLQSSRCEPRRREP